MQILSTRVSKEDEHVGTVVTAAEEASPEWDEPVARDPSSRSFIEQLDSQRVFGVDVTRRAERER
jgi:hypothetical protein